MHLGAAAVGVIIVATRASEWRLAGMAVLPQLRRAGLGRLLLDHVISSARREECERIWLEVITENLPAWKLYRQAGFASRRKLVGFRGAIRSDAAGSLPQSAPLAVVGDAVRKWGFRDLPWQVSGDTIGRLDESAIGYRLGPAFAVVNRSHAGQVTLRSLVVEPTHRRRGHASSLMKAIAATTASTEWRIPAYFPEEGFQELFAGLGLETGTIAQFHMVLELARSRIGR